VSSAEASRHGTTDIKLKNSRMHDEVTVGLLTDVGLQILLENSPV